MLRLSGAAGRFRWFGGIVLGLLPGMQRLREMASISAAISIATAVSEAIAACNAVLVRLGWQIK